MKFYNSPEATIVAIESADIITASIGEHGSISSVDLSGLFSGASSASLDPGMDIDGEF